VRLDRLQGRTDDMVIYKGVNFYPRQIEQILLRQRGLGHEYQIVLDRDGGGGERMVLCVEAGSDGEKANQARLERELGDFLGVKPEIRRLGMGEIPRPQGKAVRVVDNRNTRRDG
jgi:phenylacetate-CoA ligase